MTTGHFPIPEDVAMDLCDEVLGAGKSFGHLPDEPGDLLPIAWCFKVDGGTSDNVTDRPRVSVSVLAGTLTEARQLAARVRERFLSAGGTAVNGVLIDSVEERTGNRLTPAPSPKQPMISAVYELSFRRQ